nr:DNA-directed DNA polymerase [Tanacetum cinerariifolium]
MVELLQAPTEGYEEAIVIPKIAANNFELKHGLINLVQNKQFFGHDKEDPHAYIRYFNKITSTMRVPNVPSSSIKLMLFPFSLDGATWIWLEKEPPRSILTWEDLVTKFINKFFPPSKTTNLRNEITRFQQRFDESFYEAWDHFNDLLRACPHHGFSELHQLDTFYNALNVNDQDSLNSAAGGNFLDKMPQECLKVIESRSKVRQTQAKVVIAKVSTSSSTPAVSSEVSELKDMVRALLLDKKNQSSAPASSSTPAPVKAVNQPSAYQALAYQAPIPQTQSVSKTDFESYVKANDAILRNMQNQGQNMQIQMANLTDMLSQFVSSNTASSSGSGRLPTNTITNPKEDLKVFEPVVAPVSVPMPNLKPSIPYPSRRDNERRRDQANEQIEKFYEIFKDMSFEISFTDALILMPKFASTLKALIRNKEKLSEMAGTLMNEHCSAVILNKLPRKLRAPGKFLIPCEFPGMDECLALADLGASINLMPLFVREGISLPKLTLTCMSLELADHSVSKLIGIAKDVSVKVGVFHFPADFVVVDFEPDPRVSLILRRCFLKTGQGLIDVHKGELTLRIGNESITYNLDQTSRYSANYNQITANKINVICEMYSQEVLGFSDTTASGHPTPYDDLIVSTTSPTLTPFGDSDFLLFEEADAFLELKVCEAKTVKSSVDEPPEVELKDLPPHLEYAFLEGNNKLPVIIAKELEDEDKSALIKKEVEKLLDAGLIYPISDSPWVSPVHCVPKKGGFTVVENEENELIPTHLATGWWVCIDYQKLNEAIRKDHFLIPFMDQMIERLAGNEYYCFPDSFSEYFQIPIDPRDQEKTTFTCPYEMFAYRHTPFGLYNALGTFQRNMLAIFHDMVEKTMEVFMDDFLVFGNSFENFLSRLDKMLQRYEETNLSLHWEKSHFMVNEGIVLGHKISKNRIEVDKAKVDVIAKLPHLTTVKDVKEKTHRSSNLDCPKLDLSFELMCDASDFAIGAVLGKRHEKHFKPIHYASKMMNDAESNYTTTEKEMLAVVYAFEKFWSYLIMNKSIVHTDHSAHKYLFAKKDAKARLLWSVLLLQEFDFKVLDTKGAEK